MYLSRILLFVFIFFLSTGRLLAINYVSNATGLWGTTTTWTPAGTPTASDNVTIQSGHTITMNVNGGACLSLTINGTAYWAQGRTTNVGAGGITISSTGNVTGTANGTLTTTGNLTINSTLSSTSVTITMQTTAGLTISGTGSLARLTVNTTASNTGDIYVTTALAGSSTLTNAANAVLRIGGTATITGLTATANPNTVLYNGAGNQTMKATTYHDLEINKTAGTASTGGATTINNNFTVTAGTASVGAGNFSAAQNTSVTGTLTITSTTGTKTFNNLTINSGGTWNSSVTETYTINGNLQHDGTTFSANTGAYTLAGVGKTISGTSTLTIPNLTVSGSYTNTATLTVSTSLAGGGSLTQGTGGILGIGGTMGITTLDLTTNANTVDFNSAAASNIPSRTYHHLTKSNTGTATLSGAISVNGNISITGGTLSTGANQITGNASGTCSISSGATLNLGLTTSATNILFPTDYTTANILLDNASTVVYQANGAQTISTAPASYGNLTLATGSTTVTKTYAGTLNVNGSLALTNGTGTLTLAMDANTLNVATDVTGNGNLTFTSGTLNIGGNYSNTGTLTNTTGTVNYNGSGAQSIKSVTYYNLSVSKSAGTASFAGNTTVNNDFNFSGGTVTLGAFSLAVTATTTIGGTFSVTSITGTKTFNNVIIASGGSFSSGAAETYSISGNLTMSGGSIGGSSSGTFSVSGNMNITTGTSNSIDRCFLNISGTTTIAGTLNMTSTTGTKAFGNLIVSSGGTWNSTVAETYTINGDLQYDGTSFTANTGIYTLAGAGKTITGTSFLSIPSLTVSGTYTNTASLSVSSALSGGGTFTQGNGGVLNIGGTSAITGLSASINSNTVNYNGSGNQTVRAITYHDLKITSTGGTVTATGTYTVNNDFTIESGIVTYGNVTVAGDLFVNGGTVTVGGVTTSVTGITSVSGTINFNNVTGTKSFGDITMNATGNWNVTVAEDFSVSGNMQNDGVFTAGSGIYTLSGNTKTISGSNALAIPTVVMSGTYTNTGTFTVSTSLTGAGTLTNGANGTFNIGAADASFTLSTLTASGTNNTVNYNRAGVQTVRVPSNGSYQNLTISGSGTKSLAGTTDLIGTLTVSAGTFDVAGQTFTLISTSSATARIAELVTGTTVSGNITMQRYADPGASGGFTSLGSAVSGRIASDWSDDFTIDYGPANWPNIYYYNESVIGAASDNDWVAVTSSSQSVSPGQGFSVYLYSTNVPNTNDLIGTPNMGDISLPVTFTSTPHSDDGYNLVANPYPSQIDWDDPDWIKTNMNNAIYIWRNDIQQYASYVAGVGANGGSQYIASSQAFFVQANNSSPVLTAREGVKTASVPVFYQLVNPQTNSITLTINSGSSSMTDQAVIRFVPGATSSFDPSYDANKFFSSNASAPNIASRLPDNSVLSINSLPDPVAATVVQLVIKCPTGAFTLSASDLSVFPAGTCIVLEDTKTGSYYSLTSSYSFQVDPADSASVSPRFLLHFTPPVALSLADASCNNSADGSAVATAPAPGTWSFLWKNSAGDTIRFTPASASGSDAVSALAIGSYSVTASRSSAFCSDFTASFSISQSNPVTPLAAAQNPSCGGNGKDGNIYLSLSGGSAPYTFLWSNGAVSKDLINVPAGVYSVAITDSKGCSASISESLVQPLFVNADFAASEDTLYLSTGTTVSFLNNSSGATSFKWLFGDGDSSELQNPVHTYLSPGSFNTTLIASNSSCSDSSFTPITILEKPDGIIESELKNKLTIFSDELKNIHVLLPEGSGTVSSIVIYSGSGQTVVEKEKIKNNTKELVIGMNNLAEGFYFIRLTSDKGIYTGRFIIMNP